MIKKATIRFLLIVSLLFTTLSFADETPDFYCSQELETVYQTIVQLPEVCELVCQVLQEGPLQIQPNSFLSDQFEGYWNSNDRSVYITISRDPTFSEMIITMLFELHNASRDRDFNHIYNLAVDGLIDRDQYVEKMEYIEYENVLATSLLLKKGVEMGIFPDDCVWNVSPSFTEHFEIQKERGHSAWFENDFDNNY